VETDVVKEVTEVPAAPVVGLSLECWVNVKKNELVLELTGPPSHYWEVFYSTTSPSKDEGDWLSGEVRLELTSAHWIEDGGRGYFDDTGETKITLPLDSSESGLTIWFQAISVKDASVLETELSLDDVEMSEVCQVSY